MATEVRLRFDFPDSTWMVEQSHIRYVQDPFGLGDAPTRPYEFPSWELRSIHDNFGDALLELIELAATGEVGATQIASVDLGPVDPGSPLVASIVSSLQSLML